MLADFQELAVSRAVLFAAFVACVAGPRALSAQAGPTGSISGTITDKNSGQPIEAATVIVNGTSYGVMSKANGTYVILGVPPGTYDVTTKRVGYQQVTAQNVVVRPDISRTQDFELSVFQLLPLGPTSPRIASSVAATASAAGPGSAFGIDAYDCANCGVARYRDSVHAVYTFGAEPVVVAVSPMARDRIRPGDVIVAVNGNPITTRAGADMFAYPDSGELRLTLRRNGTNIDVFSYSLNSVRASVVPQGGRAGAGAFPRSGGVTGGGGGGRGGRGIAAAPDAARGNLLAADSVLRDRLATCAITPRSTSDSSRFQGQRVPCPPDAMLIRPGQVDSLAARVAPGGRGGAVAAGGIARSGGGGGGVYGATAAPTAAAVATSIVELRNFGFTLSCRPDCTRMRSSAGVLYWKFDGYPTVAVLSLVKGGLAEKAGIREGDVLVSVNALSPLTEEGAVLLNRSDRELELTLEFSRGGKREKYVLKL